MYLSRRARAYIGTTGVRPKPSDAVAAVTAARIVILAAVTILVPKKECTHSRPVPAYLQIRRFSGCIYALIRVRALRVYCPLTSAINWPRVAAGLQVPVHPAEPVGEQHAARSTY